MTEGCMRGHMEKRRGMLVRNGGAVLACALATALTGCVTLGPDYQRPDVALPQAWRSELPNARDVVNTEWWKGLGDPALDTLISEAIDANKDLQLATLRVEEFDAKLQVTRAQGRPQIGYNALAERRGYSEEQPRPVNKNDDGTFERVTTQNAFEVGSNFSWELDLWGRVRRAKEAAGADVMASEDARRAMMLTVVTSVATSYVQLLALDHQLELARQAEKNRSDALALVQKKYEGGAASQLDVAKARAAMYDVAVAVPDLERQVAELENATSLLLGRNPGPVKRGSLLALKLPPVPAGIPSDILERRPDVLQAEQNLVSANAKIGVAKAEYFPSISLTGLLGLGSNQIDTLLQHSAMTDSIGAGLLGTIFSGGRIKGDIRASEAVQKQMLVKYQQTIQTALREVDDALVFNAKAGEIATAGTQQLAALRDAVRLSEARYDGGQSSFIDVLDAQQDLYEAQDKQVGRDRDTYLALISIYKAMGGGWMVAQEQQRDGGGANNTATQAPAADPQASTETRRNSSQ
ncbi:efflux transporter outer membrane subunit [Pseudoluteimonas lycopersici]|uniref:Efflux transporter outer membrane subunit n=2 Tax=Pseudoluteimonas lycopersici TaxID=1324796 RepID=A0A516V6E1_9GAMM|nr:efflux transporter outer membrane subunit [Lysobacter lycopersici]